MHAYETQLTTTPTLRFRRGNASMLLETRSTLLREGRVAREQLIHVCGKAQAQNAADDQKFAFAGPLWKEMKCACAEQ